MGRARASAALLCLTLAGACTPPTTPRPPAPIHAHWPGCLAVGAFAEPYGGGSPTDLGGVPDGFRAQTVVLCEEGERTNASGETVRVDLERTSTRIAPLLAYLAQPDERPSDGPCILIAFVPPWLFLLDASGRYVSPAIPRDGCNLPIGSQGERAAWQLPDYSDHVVRER